MRKYCYTYYQNTHTIVITHTHSTKPSKTTPPSKCSQSGVKGS